MNGVSPQEDRAGCEVVRICLALSEGLRLIHRLKSEVSEGRVGAACNLMNEPASEGVSDRYTVDQDKMVHARDARQF